MLDAELQDLSFFSECRYFFGLDSKVNLSKQKELTNQKAANNANTVKRSIKYTPQAQSIGKLTARIRKLLTDSPRSL